MPHKGDLKLPPVTQGDVTTNKINATRTDSNKCHLNGVSNISVWVFTICPKRGLSSVQMWQPQDSSSELYVNYHRRYDGEIQPELLKTDGRFSRGLIQLALVSDFLIFILTKSHRTSGTPAQSHWAPVSSRFLGNHQSSSCPPRNSPLVQSVASVVCNKPPPSRET